MFNIIIIIIVMIMIMIMIMIIIIIIITKAHIFKHLRGSENCPSLCLEDCFKILDFASTSFQLKIKEAMHILWEQPSLNSQVKHLNLSHSY